jgi:hypothetical protein
MWFVPQLPLLYVSRHVLLHLCHTRTPHPHSHMYVPTNIRQRYQRRLKSLGRHSTLSDEREEKLADVGFVWDSHRASWRQHYHALRAFAGQHGHCQVPASDSALATLNTWCKHQRRQFKNFLAGQYTTLTLEKVRCLEAIGFVWNPRGI